ncbi:hypothetical protein [Leptospira noguchii]|uniref:hypothetical protein n=1 Tax=Leptospira noguchii TaxID=28182 RepID=UPI001FB57502|nr:hypothetical protein [Leptospira noguchii]UOG36296.1 hypothetical protein MAL02_19280 [Leptospira noguchii]
MLTKTCDDAPQRRDCFRGKKRVSVANDRVDLTQNLLAKEDKLRTLDPKKDKAEYEKLNKEVKAIQDRTAQLDKNFLEYKR